MVGLPVSLSGDLGPAARAVLDEVDELRLRAGGSVDVVVHDYLLDLVDPPDETVC